MSDEIRRISVPGAELGYAVIGVPQDRSPLVFVHGYAMRSTGPLYGRLLDELARDFTVHSLDLRGHGSSAAAVDGWSFENLADDVASFVRALDLTTPVFVGHSFGAVIGLHAELRHAGTFSALCLLSPGPADHRRDPVAALDFMIEHGRDRDRLRRGFEAMFVRGADASIEAMLDAVTLLDPEVHRALKRHNPSFSIDDQLGRVAPPALILSGSEDRVVAPALQHDLAGKLARSKEVVYSTEGHMHPVETPEIASREIRAFIDHDGAHLSQA